jgi:hypothetical protein
MTENEAKEIVKKLRNKAELFKNSGFAVDGIVKSFEDSANAIETLSEEIQQYRAIGTIEEFKTLKEKSVAKKVISRNSMYRCPTCESLVSVTQTKCTKCSQKLDWE